MIITVTPNPAYDVTYTLPDLEPGTVHRVDLVRVRPGGKGVNVAAVLAALGEPVTATGLASERFAADVAALGITSAFVTALPDVRRTLAVVEPERVTSLWEPGILVPETAGDDLVAALMTLLPQASAVVLSGSLPPGGDEALHARLATASVAAGVPTIVDTSGSALAAAAEVPCVVLMPNADELAELTGPCSDAREVAARSSELVSRGVHAVVATRGADGLLVTTQEGSWAARPPRPVEGNPTGAGDAAAAAVARGLARGDTWATIAADAVTLSAAAVAADVAGAFDEATRHEFAGHVVARPIEGTR